MKHYLLLSALLLGFQLQLSAQRSPSDPKHENHYEVAPFENEEVKITFKNAHSQQEFTLVELNITNKTNDYIYFKGSEAVFINEHGTYKPKGNILSRIDFSIEPLQSESKTLKVAGDNRFHVDKLKLELNGFYRI